MTIFEFIGLLSVGCVLALGLYAFVRQAAKDGMKDALRETMPWSVDWNEKTIGEIVRVKEQLATQPNEK